MVDVERQGRVEENLAHDGRPVASGRNETRREHPNVMLPGRDLAISSAGATIRDIGLVGIRHDIYNAVIHWHGVRNRIDPSDCGVGRWRDQR